MRKVNFNEQVSVKISKEQRQFIDQYYEQHECTLGATVRLLLNAGMRQLK